MGFKEQIQKDLNNVFFNQDEFAEEHDLNGIICTAVIQTESVTKRANEQYDYIYGRTLLVFCKKESLPEIPVFEQAFRLDGELYQVNRCDEDMGLLEIELVANAT